MGFPILAGLAGWWMNDRAPLRHMMGRAEEREAQFESLSEQGLGKVGG